ncbi:DNA-formamidopyrimidine glycosylase family protein [Salinimicrobium terrae]|uniref:DNA-formamidopyrimidine glycosylase family protein n=1 Tax=Salinimicrobium terrae TaxID=470866 RepID=UPI0004045F96|nr:DNA-formamidopyrimidine glycosylase family protein [Salinimicrobium terrae]
MPEGPSIILVKEATAKFVGKKVIAVDGNSKIDQNRFLNKKIIEFKSWGKHFLICFDGFTLKVHFLMFGSYTIDEKKPDRNIRLHLKFKNGEINLYACSVKYLEGDINEHYDWSSDVMNAHWDREKAKAKLKEIPELLICDALLDQDIFAGVGNIIKNEILYRVRLHPESMTGKIPKVKLNKLIDETRIYSFQFLDWKKAHELKKHWLAHTKKECLRCNLPIIKKQTGVKKRRSFICANCQVLYT